MMEYLVFPCTHFIMPWLENDYRPCHYCYCMTLFYLFLTFLCSAVSRLFGAFFLFLYIFLCVRFFNNNNNAIIAKQWWWSVAVKVTKIINKKNQNTPSLSWLEKVNILRYLGSSLSSSFSKMSSCGLQFLTCGGPSSSRSRANLAADIARPLKPSPHSFSALKRYRIMHDNQVK